MALFRNFLSEGRIGDVQLGMTPEGVARYLGQPDDRSVKSRPVKILKYGSIELAFKFIKGTNDSRVISVAIYFSFPNRSLPPAVVFEDFKPAENTTVTGLQEFLERSDIHFHSKVDGEYHYLVLDSGASVVFVDDRLHSVHFRRAEKTPPRRQMSVSLPEQALAQLRARAKLENISLQELIEKVLATTA